MSRTSAEEQEREWQDLYMRLQQILRPFGANDWRDGEYWILEDNLGSKQHTVTVMDLRVIAPLIIAEMRRQLQDFPQWEIVIIIAGPDPDPAWPPMGMYIRRDEIIDGLKREYLPPDFRSLTYDGARAGDEND